MKTKTDRAGFARFANFITALTVPMAAAWLIHSGWKVHWAVIGALVAAGAFRGVFDVIYKKLALLAQPDLYTDSSQSARADDALYRRRLHFWSKKVRWALLALGFVTFCYIAQLAFGHTGATWIGTAAAMGHRAKHLISGPMLQQLVILPMFFLFNFVIFMGPMLASGISQIRGYEPGDADWGVKLEDVRGQKEAKAEISKVITLWQSGERFAAAGGKRERGILFLGAPGVGKTMLAKAIATSFNCPFVSIPGGGFAQTFIGLDTILVRYLAAKARRLARKWGGQCIIFIDEIDAVGMRRAALAGGGSITPQMPGGMMGGMGGGAINQLLVTMDGIDNPPFLRRLFTNKVNLWLDALYVIPQSVKFSGTKTLQLRLPKAKPSGAQVYFIGATNVALAALDPALVRPGRMGRHIYFREPTKRDRADILDLYLGKVAHDPELDTPEAREELARVTQGYSPASIEQVCNLGLTYAQHSGRDALAREDVLEAMVTIEAGTALGWGYDDERELKSTAIHEAGHAVCSHLHEIGTESVRLSVKRRGQTGGHHQSVETIERTFHDRQELYNRLVCILGAYAAEVEFYGHNTQGVGGDLNMVSHLAGTMVGRWGMAPLRIESRDVQGTRRRLITLGKTLLAAPLPTDVKLSPDKYNAEAEIVGQAFVIAWNTIRSNRVGVEIVADTMVARGEVFGDDVLDLLHTAGLRLPDRVDWDDDASWPSF